MIAGGISTASSAVRCAGYLIVPLTRQGMVCLMAGTEDEAEADDLLFVPFTSGEMAAAGNMMREFERLFAFDSRGNTAEQLIDTRYADVALDVAHAAGAAPASELEASASRKMIQALKAALEAGSFVEFAFGEH